MPVVVVGNKIDVRGPDLANDHLASMMQPLMDTYPRYHSRCCGGGSTYLSLTPHQKKKKTYPFT